MDGFKLVTKHRKDCWCQHDPNGQSFVLHDGNDFDRTKTGRRGGSTLWHRFRCNDPSCEAIALVRWDVLAKFVTTGVAPSPEAGE